MTQWEQIADISLADGQISTDQAQAILTAPDAETLSILHAAFRVRRKHHGTKVQIHVLENAKRGACPEDCGFCSQSAKYESPSGEEKFETVDQLLAGARKAKAASAKRYCMVTATRGPSPKDLDIICTAAQQIKKEMNIELCASLGLLTQAKAERLAAAGIDRFNHNLETSENHFNKVVSTHSWADRVRTVVLAKQAGMETCCGGIVGLGENHNDVIELATTLRDLQVDSVPVNFLDPRQGTPMQSYQRVSANYALRALSLFRFMLPRADIRVAGGREVTLRSMQALALYPANSLFSSGYLTTAGASVSEDHQMINDLGFTIDGATNYSDCNDTAAQGKIPSTSPTVHLPIAR